MGGPPWPGPQHLAWTFAPHPKDDTESGGGPGPLPHSNRYHPSPVPTLAVPGPPLPCSPPTSAGSGTGGGGRDQPDWAATPAPNTFRISCQTGLSSPWGLFGGRDLPRFLLQGMQKGGIPPSANAIMPSPDPVPHPERSPLTVESITSVLETLVCCEPRTSLPPLPSVSPSAQPQTEGAGERMAAGFCI